MIYRTVSSESQDSIVNILKFINMSQGFLVENPNFVDVIVSKIHIFSKVFQSKVNEMFSVWHDF